MKELYATIDLGSNSFHMLTAAFEYQEIKVLDSISDKVMLAEGLSKRNGISSEAQQRGLDCIDRFSQRLQSIAKENIRIVGTNTLRAAVNSAEYVIELENKLRDISIEIISGIEEARLIYLGVSHSWSSITQQSKNLVIDIGGGSTEFIIGEQFTPLHAESLRIGCVAYRRFFPEEEINENYFRSAVIAAKLELSNISHLFNKESWINAVGSAGTFKALESVMIEQEICSEGISYEGLKVLKKELLSFSNISQISLKGIKLLREKTILPGLAIAIAIFETFNIRKMQISRGGLREGILYDLIGRHNAEDIRERSIDAISRRYGQDTKRILLNQTIADLLTSKMVVNAPVMLPDRIKRFLTWALSCSQIGLAISHSQYQNHSSYLIENSELNGFTLKERAILAGIVRNHRRKIRFLSFEKLGLDSHEIQSLIIIVFIVRLIFIISQNGKKNQCKKIGLSVSQKKLSILLEDKWVKTHKLIYDAFNQEIVYWRLVGVELKIEVS